MPGQATNRAMFWRIIRRLLGANRGRLFIILLALGAGAAVTAALLNLQVDAQHRLTTEFRAFGPNIIVAPKRMDTRKLRRRRVEGRAKIARRISCSRRSPESIPSWEFAFKISGARSDLSSVSLPDC